jgi:hemolysin activation/secretion protein
MKRYVLARAASVCREVGLQRICQTPTAISNLKLNLLAAALALVGQNAFAQQPVGGGLMQQIPPAPAFERSVPAFPSEPRKATVNPMTDVGAKISVRALHVIGQTRFSEAELVAATGFKAGSELNLTELRALAAKIVGRYNQDGYFLAQAFLPAQEIENGVVTIAVIEGRYGKIGLTNESHVSDSLINSILAGLKSDDPIETAPLERRLLIISDIPGVEAKATMAPGTAVGTSDLNVSIKPTARVTGSLEADNWGNRYTGTYRLGATVNVNNILGYGDVLSVRTLDSTTGGMFYGRVSYQAQIQDATVGVAYTALQYRLGEQFSSLNASGSEKIISVYGSYPLIRSYNDNLYALIDFDYRTFQDKIGATSSVIDKSAEVLIAGLSGNHHDMFGGGGWNTYSLIGTFGNLDIQSSTARQADALTARTNGPYAKLSGSFSRLQHLIGPLSLYGAIRGQVASRNLDISEKMELGGASAVRAYPEGESYGDQGYVATLEARLLLPKWPENWPGRVQLIAFADTGYVMDNESPWFHGRNEETRSGAGIGLTWAAENDFFVTLAYAHRLGGQPATSAPDQWGRLWVQVVKYF